MVPMVEPLACTARMVHDLTATPSINTAHAPHCPVSQPTCVPVRRKLLRMNSTSNVRGSTSSETAAPLTVSVSGTDMVNLQGSIAAGKRDHSAGAADPQ